MKHLLKLLRDNFYGATIILVLLIAVLATATNSFAFIREGMATIQTQLRKTGVNVFGQVWCTTTLTNNGAQTILGHYPGMSTEEVIKFHADAIWLLRSKATEQNTVCYRNWKNAFEAAQLDAALPEHPTDEDYKVAVMSYYLDQEARNAVPTTKDQQDSEDQLSEAATGWCYSEIKTTKNLIVTVPHAPGGRKSIDAVLNQLENYEEFRQYLVRSTLCFDDFAQAADYITGGEVQLDNHATRDEYEAAMLTWQNAKR